MFTTDINIDIFLINFDNSMVSIKKNWDDKYVLSEVDGLLTNFDDGELFVEEVFSENVLFDDNKVKNASYDLDRGFGLRTVRKDSINFFHSSDLSEEALRRGIKSIHVSRPNSHSKKNNLKANTSLYDDDNPITQIDLKKK